MDGPGRTTPSPAIRTLLASLRLIVVVTAIATLESASLPRRFIEENHLLPVLKDASSALTIGQSLLTNIRNAMPMGRLVIDLQRG